MKHVVLGILAHVDAGKTTLTESLLYTCGAISSLGRVDHGTAVLDYDVQEKNRGITIYSKEARFTWQDCAFTLLDTPGHIDFSCEMERVLKVLDYAIVVVNGIDGIQAHTETIWKLLRLYHIPTFVFINKMDMTHHSKEELFEQVKQRLHINCIDMESEDMEEQVALCNETLLDEYMETQKISICSMQEAIAQEVIFPCFFGSALKLEAIDTLLQGLTNYTKQKVYPDNFGAYVYKISHDSQGNRLTHMKITGGTLYVKQVLKENEKVDQIRCYSGKKFESPSEIEAGQICAVKGLRDIQIDEWFGNRKEFPPLQLVPYLQYEVCLLNNCDKNKALKQLQLLEAEDPFLQIVYENEHIFIAFMGELQVEVFQQQVLERFGLEVSVKEGTIIYKETIEEEVEGVGHYEPLRHYAEVHLLLQPLPYGSGIQYTSVCDYEVLDKHWQHIIMQHIQSNEFKGVLTGSYITDMKLTLLCGKAHQKHSEGPDFRQAVDRAIRQGLKKANSVILEPYYQFTLHIPHTYVSKAIYDIECMHAEYEVETQEKLTCIKGIAPIAYMKGYAKEVLSYSKGLGRLVCTMLGYRRCVNQEEIVSSIGYDCDADYDHPSGSIFCKQGAGFYVPWNEVEQHMHMQSAYAKQQKTSQWHMPTYHTTNDEDAQLQQIFEKTYGKKKEKDKKKSSLETKQIETYQAKPSCILVDGYNLIHAWDDVKHYLPDHMDTARQRCIDMMCSYKGYRNCELILVFDAYQSDASLEKVYEHDGIYIVYTKKAQTADTYIEQATKKLASEYQVSVVTSDGLEQLIAYGQGALRIPSKTFIKEYEQMHKTRSAYVEHQQKRHRTYLLEDIRKYQEE